MFSFCALYHEIVYFCKLKYSLKMKLKGGCDYGIHGDERSDCAYY